CGLPTACSHGYQRMPYSPSSLKRWMMVRTHWGEKPTREAMSRLPRPLPQRGQWKKGLTAKRDEPWFLITDLPGNAVELTALYARRMAVEELFRDDKSLRTGWALRQTKVTTAARFDRLLLVLAWGYWLLVGLGLLARQRHRPAAWCSSNRDQECS